MSQLNFNTHVWVGVRIKVNATNFSQDPKEIQDKVSDALACDTSDIISIHTPSTLMIDGKSYAINDAERSQEVYFTLVDQEDLSDPSKSCVEHHFDHMGLPLTGCSGFYTAKEHQQSIEIERLQKEVSTLKAALAQTETT